MIPESDAIPADRHHEAVSVWWSGGHYSAVSAHGDPDGVGMAALDDGPAAAIEEAEWRMPPAEREQMRTDLLAWLDGDPP